MRSTMRHLVLMGAIFLGVIHARADEWPAYRHDPQRTSVSPESLAFPLRLSWKFLSAQKPSPAWGEMLNLTNRVDFDYAPAPVIAGGLLCFGSTADDTVRALDAATGIEKWRVTTGGPVRVAPQIVGDKIYFASDDGLAYCVRAADGGIIWTFRPGPEDERIVGNQRMISRWPVRSGVLVDEGVAFCVGGMWSMEGVFVYALNAETGKVIWCRDTLGFGGIGMADFIGMGVNGHHQGEYGAGGSNPQGPLVLGGETLFMPCGFAAAVGLKKKDGGQSVSGGGPVGSGGTWLAVDGNTYYCFSQHGQAQMALNLVPHNLKTGEVGRVISTGTVPQLSVGPQPQLKPGEIHEKGKVSALINNGQVYAKKAYGIAMAGSALLLGHDGKIVAEETKLQTSAEIRFGISGGNLIMHAVIADKKVIQAATPWKGSCIEVFGAQVGKPEIGQIFLTPGTGDVPARALRSVAGKTAPAPEIQVQSVTTSEGYELSAIIPMAMLALDPASTEVRLEAQVTVTASDNTVQRDTLFGSPSAYNNSDRFGLLKLRPLASAPKIEQVKTSLATAKPSTIKMRGNSILWSEPVDGEAREFAIANGRLYVTTEKGTIYCFESASAGDPKKPVIHDPASAVAPLPAPSAEAAKVIDQLRRDRVDRGLAMVMGDDDGQLALALAAQTRLNVILVLSDAAAAQAMRHRLVGTTNWYGSRIHVHTIARAEALPFPQFFANAVIVARPGIVNPQNTRELYRVLHPCGGVLLAPDLSRDAAEAAVKVFGAKSTEIIGEKSDLRIVRGKLPGATDWDSPRVKDAKGVLSMPPDQRVKWPLRPLWWGGPNTLQIRNFLQGADGPVVANGRYFIKSENNLTAVDAYNGIVLWSRPIPQQVNYLRSVDGALFQVNEPTPYPKEELRRFMRVNDDSIFFTLGKAYTRGRAEAVIQLDARTGEQLKFAGPFLPPTSIGLGRGQTWPVNVDENHSGTISLEKTERGIVVTMSTKDRAASKLDAWELFFDMRPPESRYGLYGKGTFHVRITLAENAKSSARWNVETGDAPMLEVTGSRDADGAKAVAVIPWSEIEKLTSGRPTSFGFAATLNSHDGGRDERVERRHLFGDWAADGINNGWAVVHLEDVVPDSVTQPSVVVAGSELKVASGSVGSGGRALGDLITQTPRIHPLTGEIEPKVYRPSTLCGGSYFSDQVMSGRAGFYDFADDSGMRFLGGIKSRCTSPQVIALGMILVSEETGHCSCNYPYRTSLAIAPAERRLNEDWAIFHDREPDTKLRTAAIMLGAPGDRRDDNGTLWLGFPRAPSDKGVGYSFFAGTNYAVTAPGTWMRFTAPMLQVPLEAESYDGPDAYNPADDIVTNWNWSSHWAPNRKKKAFGPDRMNPDRVKVANTDRPWIYASSYRGIRKATLKLNFVPPLASLAADGPIVIDGKLEDAAWKGDPQAKLPFTATDIFIRHDAEKLYVSLRRPPVVDRMGKFSPWASKATGEDAAVWQDDSCEIFLSDADGKKVMHLGVSASGARFDATSGDEVDDKSWNGQWSSGASATEEGLSFELAIPWKTLESAGLRRDALAMNVLVNQKDVSGEANKYPGYSGRNYEPAGTTPEALCNLGPRGRSRCEHFSTLSVGAKAVVAPRQFTVRLHFAELEDAAPGQRVFDVKLQGKVVIAGLDVAREAGVRTALVKEFRHVVATDALSLEFVAAQKDVTPANAPFLSAIEVYDESFQQAKK